MLPELNQNANSGMSMLEIVHSPKGSQNHSLNKKMSLKKVEPGINQSHLY